jgi:hypothetical protein
MHRAGTGTSDATAVCLEGSRGLRFTPTETQNPRKNPCTITEMRIPCMAANRDLSACQTSCEGCHCSYLGLGFRFSACKTGPNVTSAFSDEPRKAQPSHDRRQVHQAAIRRCPRMPPARGGCRGPGQAFPERAALTARPTDSAYAGKRALTARGQLLPIRRRPGSASLIVKSVHQALLRVHLRASACGCLLPHTWTAAPASRGWR